MEYDDDDSGLAITAGPPSDLTPGDYIIYDDACAFVDPRWFFMLSLAFRALRPSLVAYRIADKSSAEPDTRWVSRVDESEQLLLVYDWNIVRKVDGPVSVTRHHSVFNGYVDLVVILCIYCIFILGAVQELPREPRSPVIGRRPREVSRSSAPPVFMERTRAVC